MSVKELKGRARAAIEEGGSQVYWVTLVWLLLTTGLSILLSYVVPDPVQEYLTLVEARGDYIQALQVFLPLSASLALFLQVVIVLYGVVFQYGYQCYAYHLVRQDKHRPASPQMLLEGFYQVGRVLFTRALLLLVLVPITLLMSLGVSSLGAAILLVLPISTATIMAVGIGASVVTAVLVLLYACRYAMTTFLMIEQGRAYWDALRESARMMTGHLREYVVLHLSLLGWFLLSEGVAVGIPVLLSSQFSWAGSGIVGGLIALVCALPVSVWFSPYLSCARAAFYEAVRKKPSAENSPFLS